MFIVVGSAWKELDAQNRSGIEQKSERVHCKQALRRVNLIFPVPSTCISAFCLSLFICYVLPSQYCHPPSSYFKRFTTGRSRYKRTVGFALQRCQVSDPKPWAPREGEGQRESEAPQLTRNSPSPFFSSPLYHDSWSFARQLASIPYFDSGGHEALRNFAGCFAPRETNTLTLFSSLSRFFVPTLSSRPFCFSYD